MKFSLIILSVIVATVSSGVVQPSRNPLIKLPKYSIQPHLSGEGRITNGNIATPGQFPYQVGLVAHFGNNDIRCGAILISNTYVLTAAQCIYKADDAIVILGAHNINNGNEEHQIRVNALKTSFIIHEQFNLINLKNDIALIKLVEPVNFNDYIQPATLPSKNSYSNYKGDSVIASGWGTISDISTSTSSELRYIEVKVISNWNCNVVYGSYFTSGMLCISTIGGKSTCKGDSGGPLVHKENGENILVGITSFGFGLGCQLGFPTVFTRTTSYLDWIEQHSGVVNNA